MEGRPQDRSRRRRLLPRRPRPPAADAARPGGRHRPQDGQLRVVRRRRRAAAGASSATRSTSPPPASASSSTRSRPATVRVLATSGEKRIDARRRPDPQGVRHRPGLHQLARHRGPSRHHRRRQGSAWIDAFDEDARQPGVEGRAEAKHGWTDAFLTGDEFGTFLTEQDKRVADILTDAGAGMSAVAVTVLDGSQGRAELGVALLLGGGRRGRPRRRRSAWTPRTADADPVGPQAVPDRRRPSCCSSAPSCSPSTCCAAATARPRAARTSTSTAPTDWRIVLPAAGGLRRQRAAHRPLGWVDLRRDAVLRLRPSRSAAGTYVRDLLISVALVAGHLLRLLPRPRHPPARRHPGRGPLMDVWSSLHRRLRHRADAR